MKGNGDVESTATLDMRESALSQILRERTRSLQEQIDRESHVVVERARKLAHEIHALNHHPKVIAAARELARAGHQIVLTGRWEHRMHFIEKSMSLIGGQVSFSTDQGIEKRAIALTENGIEIVSFPAAAETHLSEDRFSASPAISTRSLIGAAELGWESIRAILFSRIEKCLSSTDKCCG
jgi:hypothetical protein